MRAPCWPRQGRRLPLVCLLLFNTLAFWVFWRLPVSGADNDEDQWDTVVWEEDTTDHETSWSNELLAPDLRNVEAIVDIDRIPLADRDADALPHHVGMDPSLDDKHAALVAALGDTKTTKTPGHGDRERAYFEPFSLGEVSILSPPRTDRCRQPSIALVLVCSAAQRADLRQAIRHTWGQPDALRAAHLQLLFVLGRPVGEYAALEGPLAEEHRRFGDVLQLDLPDTPRHLTQRTLVALAWVRDNCARPVFVVKTDDDVFLNTAALATELTDLASKPDVMFGYVIENAQPSADRADKWYMPAHLLETRTFPPYLSGSAYALSSDLVEKLLVEIDEHEAHIFWLEDIYVTGMLGSEVGGRLVHTPRVLYRKSKGFKACDLHDAISVHGFGAHDLSHYWQLFLNPSEDCIPGGSRLHLSGEIIK